MNEPSGRSRLTFIIFSAVGVVNTLFDFTLYYVLFNISGSIIVANIASTSAALIFSYIINSRVTFKSKQWTVRSFAGFVLVTIFGLWVLQTAGIYIVSHYLYLIPENIWHLFGGFEKTARTLAPKVFATSITLVWNYLWYSKVIFKHENKPSPISSPI